MNKYPVVITYKDSKDNGLELRYAIRSLENIQNWNGELIIAGDTEKWLTGITHIKAPRRHYSPYKDVEYKISAALNQPFLPEYFILSMDDVYITEPTLVRPLHGGIIGDEQNTGHQRMKYATKKWLIDRGISEPLNYDIHVPVIINKQRRLEVSDMISNTLDKVALQARSVYGNIYGIAGDYYEDQKTKTTQLKEGEFISTQFYTDELNTLFPTPSRFEADQ